MKRGLRWLAPVASGGAVAAYALVPALLAGTAGHPALPAITAQDLLTRVESAHVAGLHGTVQESTDLGLPSLPSGDSSSALSLLTGDHTLQVDQAGRDLRVAVLGSLSEQDLVVNAQGVWTYDSKSDTATHTALPQHGEHQSVPPTAELTPQESAQAALAEIDPTTTVTIDRTTRVAGRDAYTLVLAPKQTGSLISRVEIAIDAKTGVPLRTVIYAARQKTAALSVAFSSISYAVPSASTFDAPDAPITPASAGSHATSQRTGTAAKPSLSSIGSGWTTVERITGQPLSAADTTQLDQISTAVAGGRLITTSLLSVLITPSGTTYVGAVAGSTLESLAASAR
jgi:outer membrane lipoprotein-sorting protein